MTTVAETGRLELGELATDLVRSPIEYAVLLPAAAAEPLPFLYMLHGGNGGRDFLNQARRFVERAWAAGTLPPCVVATPSVTRSFYMNYRDGSERWEDAVVGPLLDHLRSTYGASDRQENTLIAGISMGGMGGLRIAFKHPDRFAGVAALEPGIEPSLTFAGIEIQDRFWRDDALFRRIYGDPVDEDYWQANNPANIAVAEATRLRESGLAIYLDCGDRDSFGLHRGSEFLHRALYDKGIPHEFRLVRGADHLGASLPPRFALALTFLGHALAPPPPDPSLEPLHQLINGWRARAGLEPLAG